MVRFQPPTSSSRWDEEEDATDDELHATSAPVTPHKRFAAPVIPADEEEEDEAEEDQQDNEQWLDDHKQQQYPYDRSMTDDDQLPTRRIVDEDEEDTEEEQSAALAVSNAQKSNKQWFGLQENEEDDFEEKKDKTDYSAPIFQPLHKQQLSFTPNTQLISSEQPAARLAALVSRLPSLPPATVSAYPPSSPSSRHSASQRKAFHVGWGVDGRVVLIRGSRVTVTVVAGDDHAPSKAVRATEQQGRVQMMLKLLKVHANFSEAQDMRANTSNATMHPTQSRSSLFPATIVTPAAQSFATSSSSLASLCDRYIAVISPLLAEYISPPPTSTRGFTAPPFTFAAQLRHIISVFQLVKVLFAPEYGTSSLSSFLATDSSSSSSSSSLSSASSASARSAERYARLHHVIQWLEKHVSAAVSYDIKQAPASSSPFAAAFPMLTGHLISEATELCLSTYHMRLATLLPSLSSVSRSFSERMTAQMQDWVNSGMWQMIGVDEQQVYALLAGEKNVAGLEWLRAFAVHTFYQHEDIATINNAVDSYSQAVQYGKAAQPTPLYKPQNERLTSIPTTAPIGRRIMEDDDVNENQDDALMAVPTGQPSVLASLMKTSRDSRFELLAVYAGSVDLTGLFSPSSSTPDVFDYCLSFHLHHTITFSPLFPYPNYHHLLTSYVHQLEVMGLWYWAVYVLMQCQTMQRRHRVYVDAERISRDIIGRHTTHTPDADTQYAHTRLHMEQTPYAITLSTSTTTAVPRWTEDEVFLVNQVRVPTAWLYAAKAVAAYYAHDYTSAVAYYLAAEEWNTAHTVLMQHTAAAYILTEQTTRLFAILSTLSQHARVINNWEEEGGLYLSYLQLFPVIDQHLKDMSDSLTEAQEQTVIADKESMLRLQDMLISKKQRLNSETAAESRESEQQGLLSDARRDVLLQCVALNEMSDSLTRLIMGFSLALNSEG